MSGGPIRCAGFHLKPRLAHFIKGFSDAFENTLARISKGPVKINKTPSKFLAIFFTILFTDKFHPNREHSIIIT
jgi:hypothetical protein